MRSKVSRLLAVHAGILDKTGVVSLFMPHKKAKHANNDLFLIGKVIGEISKTPSADADKVRDFLTKVKNHWRCGS